MLFWGGGCFYCSLLHGGEGGFIVGRWGGGVIVVWGGGVIVVVGEEYGGCFSFGGTVQYIEESNIYLCFVVCRLKRGLVT